MCSSVSHYCFPSGKHQQFSYFVAFCHFTFIAVSLTEAGGAQFGPLSCRFCSKRFKVPFLCERALSPKLEALN